MFVIPASAQNRPTATITVQTSLRAGPALQAAILVGLRPGTQVQVEARYGGAIDWFLVQTEKAQRGWVAKRQLRFPQQLDLWSLPISDEVTNLASKIANLGTIGFVSRGSICRIQTDGHFKICFSSDIFYRNLAWSPDGQQIAAEWGPRSPHGRQQIIMMNADGSNKSTLLNGTLNGDEFDAESPAWAPDGTRLIFSGSYLHHSDPYAYSVQPSQAESHHLFVINVTNHDLRILTQPRPNEWDRNPVWSPDGAHIAFVMEKYNAKPALYMLNADGTALRQLTDLEASTPAWSPDSRQIAFTSRLNGKSMIYLINVDGSGLQPLVAGTDPSWSPDGKYLLFGLKESIALLKLGESTPVIIPNTRGYSTSAEWQPRH